jgi:hypothetical protein
MAAFKSSVWANVMVIDAVMTKTSVAPLSAYGIGYW